LKQPWFFIEGVKIYVVFDPSHLLKNFRNAIIKYDLKLPNGDVAKMKYVSAFIKRDLEMTPRLAPKVQLKHCNPNSLEKMRVPLAAHRISRSVAAGVVTYARLGALPAEANIMGQLFMRVNDLFDSMNGILNVPRAEEDNYKVAVTADSGHEELWKAMLAEMV